MRYLSCIVLLALIAAVVVPRSLPYVPATEDTAEIGVLDVCHTNDAAAAGAEMPLLCEMVQSVPFYPAPYFTDHASALSKDRTVPCTIDIPPKPDLPAVNPPSA